MSVFNKSAIETLNRLAAQKILEKMRISRMSSTENTKRRWIWELLQNANDKAAIDFPKEQVSIFIELTTKYINFSHNYSYFTSTNVEGLIRQISSEDKDWGQVDRTQIPKTIGRFGTGFLTTHLLSEQVNVSGVLRSEANNETGNKNCYFQKITFPIDRSGRELSNLIKSINDSFQYIEDKLSFLPKARKQDFSAFNTSFQYELDEEGKSIAEIGLDDLENSLPYTLIFVDKIESVKIVRNNNEIFYKKQEGYNLNSDIRIVEFDKSINGQVEKLNFAVLSNDLTSLAIQITIKDNQTFINSFAHSTPKIFLGFPLIGTEDFNFPVVINNPFFEPTEPRDGVFLTDKREENIINNKKILQDSINLYFILLQHAESNNWQNLYLLASTDLPKNKDWISTDWYKNEVQKILREELMRSMIVYTDNPLYPKIKVEDALFPYNASKSKISIIWEFAKALWSNRLPKREHIEFWYEIIDDTWEKDLRYNLKELVEDIASFENVNQMATRISQSENDALNWLNQVIEFVFSEKQELLDKYAIIPNQYGEFITKEELWADNNIPEELKDILKILQEDWRAKLKHNQIKTSHLTITKGIKDIVYSINQIIKDQQNKNIKLAVFELIACFPSYNHKEGYDFWKFSKEFYQETPSQKILINWESKIWEECHNWFINNICQDIEDNEKVTNLTAYLKQDALKWLRIFVNFIIEHDFENCLNNYAVLPNQRGDFKHKKELFIDDKVDDTLKDILEELGSDWRSNLLAIEVELDIEDKILTSKKVANETVERVQEILKNEGIGQRPEKTRQIFAKILLWFHENENLAKEIFSDLYEKRYRLRSDEEIIEDIKFRQAIINNSNGYTEEEILQLINTPKDELLKFQQWKEREDTGTQEEAENLINHDPQDLLTGLGIYSPEELERAKRMLVGTKIVEALRHIPSNSLEAFNHVRIIIERAKKNVKTYLNNKDEYNCEKWYEETFTVIAGIKKYGIPIKIVVRPSDGGQVIIFYQSEFDALEISDTELWIDNNKVQEILTLGKVLKTTGIDRIPLYRIL
ncbi:MAG: hypothetical protein HCA25_00500 (plasmid) [Dolichospermum sp. DET50]|nr:hypothetical protein [Dolichospermum sp. DET66]MBS3035982.1 hypothetical protein [Dolichospermum sp. DET67]MBS3041150.1 hypothetical protein [Dolichospermum sp. DET50]QSX70891.1 MAG: hypothetical protein EZY12_27225 [Dolichospermum sp. DET69]